MSKADRAALDVSLTNSLACVSAVAVAMALIGLMAFGWRSALGLAVGGLAATVNLWLFAYIGRGVLQGGRKAKLWTLAGAAKLLALLVGAYYLLGSGIASGLTIAIGYGSLPVGLVIGSWLRTDDDAHAHAPPHAGGGPKRDLVEPP